MKNLESKELEKLSDSDLTKKLNDLRSEFSKLKSGAARGTLKKELGEIKTVRRNIARVLTSVSARNAMKRQDTSKSAENAKTKSATSEPRQKE